MKAAVYLRTSSKEQVGERLDIQRTTCEALCAQQGWEIVAVYEDADAVGSTMDRPGLQRLLDDALTDKWDVIVVHQVGRLSGSVPDLRAICEDCLWVNGKGLASCTESASLQTPVGRLLNLLGIYTDSERDPAGKRPTDPDSPSSRPEGR